MRLQDHAREHIRIIYIYRKLPRCHAYYIWQVAARFNLDTIRTAIAVMILQQVMLILNVALVSFIIDDWSAASYTNGMLLIAEFVAMSVL